MVRTEAFQALNRSSILRGVMKTQKQHESVVFVYFNRSHGESKRVLGTQDDPLGVLVEYGGVERMRFV